jgi:dynein heavy chain
VLALTSGSGEDSNQSNDQAIKMLEDILNQLREPFKIKDVEKRYPFKYEESMNSVLLQELARFNNLLERINSSSRILIKTL